MEKFEDLMDRILATRYYSLWEVEELLPSEAKLVKSDLDVERHRWYETSTSVYKIGDRFLGIKGPTRLYSEGMDWEDTYETVDAFEMKEIVVKSYKVI